MDEIVRSYPYVHTELVHLFYSNIWYEMESGRKIIYSWVKGHCINLSQANVNELFGLPNPDETVFVRGSWEDTIEPREVVESFLSNGQPLTTKKRPKKKGFGPNQFDIDLRILALISSQYIQGKVSKDLNAEDYWILYCLLKHKPLNFGQIFIENIFESRIRPERQFSYGMLLTIIMAKKGIPIELDECTVSEEFIDKSTLNTIVGHRGLDISEVPSSSKVQRKWKRGHVARETADRQTADRQTMDGHVDPTSVGTSIMLEQSKNDVQGLKNAVQTIMHAQTELAKQLTEMQQQQLLFQEKILAHIGATATFGSEPEEAAIPSSAHIHSFLSHFISSSQAPTQK